MSRLRRQVLDAALMIGLAVLLFAGLEVATRVLMRLRTGAWPHTLDVVFDEARRATATLYRPHPFLLTAPREGAGDPRAGRITINTLGYRSPERPLRKPDGTARVLCAGGSTTYDTLAASNALTWPARLEAEISRSDRPVEVWNAGFPGWTSLENLIALASRDVDLHPDVVVLYQGGDRNDKIGKLTEPPLIRRSPGPRPLPPSCAVRDTSSAPAAKQAEALGSGVRRPRQARRFASRERKGSFRNGGREHEGAAGLFLTVRAMTRVDHPRRLAHVVPDGPALTSSPERQRI